MWCLAGITVSSVVVMGLLGLTKVFDSEKWMLRDLCHRGRNGSEIAINGTTTPDVSLLFEEGGIGSLLS